MSDNMLYMNLKKRLMLLKLVTEADKHLSEGEKLKKLAQINVTLKLLDARYDDGKYLDPIESELSRLEHTN